MDTASSPFNHLTVDAAARRRIRQEQREAKREQRHEQYRKDSAAKDRKAMRRQGIKTFNTEDEGW